MKRIPASHYLIAFLSAGFCQMIVASDFKYVDELVNDLTQKSIEFYCGDNWLVNEIGMGEAKCSEVTIEFANQCGVLIRPFVPDIDKIVDSGADFRNAEEQLDKLGKLFSICIQGKAFAKRYEIRHKK